MQKFDAVKIGIVDLGQSAYGHQLKFFHNMIFFSILGLSFDFQTNTLSKNWDSLTNQCFLWPSKPAQMAIAWEKKFGTYFLPKWM